MRIAHISDLHVTAAPDGPGLVRGDAPERARALIAALMRFRPAIDLVVITGDNTNTGSAEEYDFLKEILSPLAIPHVIIPGNHDERATLRATFPHLPYEDADFLHYEHVQGDVRVLALDTFAPGETGGRLCPRRIGWLKDKLLNPFNGPTFIALHHPPCPTHMGVLDRATLIEGAAELRALVDAAAAPVTILCGHMHRPFEARWGKAMVFAATSPAFEFALSLDDPEEPNLSDTPYFYQLHILDADGGHTVHRVTPEL